jgi:uncharacterized protein
MAFDPLIIIILLSAGLWAGAQNALAGGGSFITLPVLMLTGLDARMANLTSTIALFPGQVVAGVSGRKMIDDTGGLPLPILIGVNVAGGVAGAVLLLVTPSSVFAVLVPWLILFATLLNIWSGFGPKRRAPATWFGPFPFAVAQFFIAIYGGYFGGGNGFLMIAALSVRGLAPRGATALKNMLLALINAAAVLVFIATSNADFGRAALLGAAAIVGGLLGTWLLSRINETLLRLLIIGIGIALTVWLFISAPA